MHAFSLKKSLFYLFLLYPIFFNYVSKAKALDTSYPLTLKNCGRLLHFQKPPQHVISLGQNSTEILYALGLFDKVKATALWYSAVLQVFSKQDKKILRLSDNEPSLETILKLKPDMIANHLEWAIGPRGIVGSYQQFDQFQIPVYTAPADCIAKDNTQKYDGKRFLPFSMSRIYQEIKEIGMIFNVQNKANILIQKLKQQEFMAIEKAKTLPKKNLTVLFWYSSFKKNGPPYVAGTSGVPAYICKKLRLKNIVSSQSEWPQMSWETIVKINPDVIVLADMTRQRYPMDQAIVKAKFLATNPLTKLLKAVQNDHILIVDAQSMNPTIRIPSGMQDIVTKLKKMNF